MARGEAAAARGDNAAALQAFRETLALDPGYTTAQVRTSQRRSRATEASSPICSMWIAF